MRNIGRYAYENEVAALAFWVPLFVPAELEGQVGILGCEGGRPTFDGALPANGFFDGDQFSFAPLTDEGFEAIGEMADDLAFLGAIEACSDSVEHLVELFELLSADNA